MTCRTFHNCACSVVTKHFSSIHLLFGSENIDLLRAHCFLQLLFIIVKLDWRLKWKIIYSLWKHRLIMFNTLKEISKIIVNCSCNKFNLSLVELIKLNRWTPRVVKNFRGQRQNPGLAENRRTRTRLVLLWIQGSAAAALLFGQWPRLCSQKKRIFGRDRLVNKRIRQASPAGRGTQWKEHLTVWA